MNTLFFLSSILPFADRLLHTMTFCISSACHSSPWLPAFFNSKNYLDSTPAFDVEVVSVQKKFELRDTGKVFKKSRNSTLKVWGIYFQAVLQTNSGVQVTILSHLYGSRDFARLQQKEAASSWLWKRLHYPFQASFPWLRKTQDQLLCLQPKMHRNDPCKKPFGWEENQEQEDISEITNATELGFT